MPLRRQDLPDAWCLNGAVYVVETRWFLQHRTFLSSRTVAFAMPGYPEALYRFGRAGATVSAAVAVSGPPRLAQGRP